MMMELQEREMHLIKKALAIAILTIDRESGVRRPNIEAEAMKDIVENLVSNLDDMVLLVTSARRSMSSPVLKLLAAE